MEPLLNIEDTLQVSAPVRMATQVEVVSEVRARPVLTGESSHLSVAQSEWGWRELRDYVVTSIESRFGAFPREVIKEGAIFDSFLKRWDGMAVPIARYAFETCEGMWKNAPIGVNRFCRGSDPYFSCRIAQRIKEGRF